MHAREDLPVVVDSIWRGVCSFLADSLLPPLCSRSVPPKLFDHRTNSDSSTPPPFSFSSSPATPASSLLSPQSLPAHVSILASGNPEDDGEILEDEMKDLKNGKGGKRRSASVFRCESCSKVRIYPSLVSMGKLPGLGFRMKRLAGAPSGRGSTRRNADRLLGLLGRFCSKRSTDTRPAWSSIDGSTRLTGSRAQSSSSASISRSRSSR